jgi:hypothetical protein
VRHFRLDLLLQLLMFIREFPDVTLYGHHANLTVQHAQIRSLIAPFVTPFCCRLDCALRKTAGPVHIFEALGEVMRPSYNAFLRHGRSGDRAIR